MSPSQRPLTLADGNLCPVCMRWISIRDHQYSEHPAQILCAVEKERRCPGSGRKGTPVGEDIEARWA